MTKDKVKLQTKIRDVIYDYEFAVSSMRMAKVKNPEEVVKVFLSVGYEETYVDKNGYVFIGGYNNTIDDENIVVINKETGKVVAVTNSYGEYYRDVETGQEIEDIDEDRLSEPDSAFEAQEIFEYLQDQLLDGEVMAIVEAGWEKLRYVGACLVVVTNKRIEWRNTGEMIDEIAKEMLEKNNGTKNTDGC